MPKPIVFIAALLLALPAFAQTLLPARQVSVNTNGTAWTSIAPTATTAQASFDWIDANWGALDASGFATMPTNLSTYQLAFDWLDANLDPGLSTNAWLFLKPSNATSQATFDFIDAYMGIDTNDWGYLAPTASTVQATFTWLDGWASGVGTGPFISGTNIAGATYNETNLTWEGLGNMPGTNIAGFTYSTSTMAWTDITLSNSMTAYKTTDQVDASYVPGEWGAITNYDSVINGNSALFNLASGCFSPAVSGLYAVAASVRKENTFLSGYNDYNEFAFGVATSPSGGICPFSFDTEEGTTVGSGATLISVTNTSVDIYLTFWAATNLTSSNAIRNARFDVWLVAPY